MKYRLSKSAEHDLLQIWEYTSNVWGPGQAEKYLKRLESRHVIFFCPYENGIAIARVLHERMDIEQRLVEDPGVI